MSRLNDYACMVAMVVMQHAMHNTEHWIALEPRPIKIRIGVDIEAKHWIALIYPLTG